MIYPSSNRTRTLLAIPHCHYLAPPQTNRQTKHHLTQLLLETLGLAFLLGHCLFILRQLHNRLRPRKKLAIRQLPNRGDTHTLQRRIRLGGQTLQRRDRTLQHFRQRLGLTFLVQSVINIHARSRRTIATRFGGRQDLNGPGDFVELVRSQVGYRLQPHGRIENAIGLFADALEDANGFRGEFGEGTAFVSFHDGFGNVELVLVPFVGLGFGFFRGGFLFGGHGGSGGVVGCSSRRLWKRSLRYLMWCSEAFGEVSMGTFEALEYDIRFGCGRWKDRADLLGGDDLVSVIMTLQPRCRRGLLVLSAQCRKCEELKTVLKFLLSSYGTRTDGDVFIRLFLAPDGSRQMIR